MELHWTYRFFFLFERASKTADTVRARLFLMSLFIRKKSIERSMSQKTAWKYGKSGIFVLFCTKIEGRFKKRSLTVSAAFDALSNKKQILGFMLYFGWVILQIRCKTHLLRKNEKHFSVFQKIAGFSSSTWRKSSKFLVKKEVLDRKLYQFWKIWRRAIFPYTYLDFGISAENWLFWGGGRP